MKPALIPHARARKVLDITHDYLLGNKIQALGLDLDNTVVPYKSETIDTDVRDHLRALQKAGIKLAIISNTNRPERLELIANEVNACPVACPIFSGKAKPHSYGYLKAMMLLNIPHADRHTMAMAGDQLMTDIRGALWLDMHAILVDPLSPFDHWTTKLFNRSRETRILAALEQQGVTIPYLGSD